MSAHVLAHVEHWVLAGVPPLAKRETNDTFLHQSQLYVYQSVYLCTDDASGQLYIVNFKRRNLGQHLNLQKTRRSSYGKPHEAYHRPCNLSWGGWVPQSWPSRVPQSWQRDPSTG